jgi:hypothetical protein
MYNALSLNVSGGPTWYTWYATTYPAAQPFKRAYHLLADLISHAELCLQHASQRACMSPEHRLISLVL